MTQIVRPPTAFTLDSHGPRRRVREHNEAHLAFIRRLPCLACGCSSMIQAAHVRFGDPRLGKRRTGMQEKPDDKYTVPLCGDDHADQHAHNEQAWWREKGIDPVRVAQSLWTETGNDDAGQSIIRYAQQEAA